MTLDLNLLLIGITAIISLCSIPLAKWFEIRNEKRTEIETNRRRVYLEYVNAICLLLTKGKEEIAAKTEQQIKKVTQDKITEAVNRLNKLKPELLLWGSAKAVSAFSHFQNDYIWQFGEGEKSQSNQYQLEMMERLEDVWLAMRRDVGQTQKISRGELISLFIKDYWDIKKKYLSS